jgi:hypothetical protein
MIAAEGTSQERDGRIRKGKGEAQRGSGGEWRRAELEECGGQP